MTAMASSNVEKTVFLETDAAESDFEKEAAYVGKLCKDETALVSAAVIGGNLVAPDFKEYVDKMASLGFVKVI